MVQANENRARLFRRTSERLLAGCAALFALAIPITSRATVTISANLTHNMTCSNGMCAPTAADAILNISDLDNQLALGSVTVTTTGAGGVQASDINVESA